MIRLIFFLICISLFLFRCKQADNKLKEKLYGEWEHINPQNAAIGTTSSTGEVIILPPVGGDLPGGISFGKDSLEIFQGIFKNGRDKITKKLVNRYLGSFTPYKTDKNDIIVFNPKTQKWERYWKFVELKNDTLLLSVEDSLLLRYKKLRYEIDPDAEFFDQIVYSSSGCYGSCPIIDISLNKDGDILFQGEGYVEPLGFYSTKTDQKATKFIFEKFKRAGPQKLHDVYLANYTDGEEITTTFIKNGKIIKTIADYGKKAPKDLLWAYIPLGNLHNAVHLEPFPQELPYYPKLSVFTFSKNGRKLLLAKSESFYLWTELKKSKSTEKSFKPIYELSLSSNSVYFGPDPNKKRMSEKPLKIMTDGQIFKFTYKNQKNVTYDLGYNFISRNFKPEDFKDE